MYERFYQLRERPFALSPDPDYLYPSRVHQEALDYLRYALESHAGFVVITGEIGSGKTTLLQTLMRSLDGDTISARIVNTMLDPRELIEAMLIDFGLEAGGRSKPQMLHDLAAFLVAQRRAGRPVLLVVDEAQNLTAAALEELRMLSNLETEKAKLMQIVLIGQPDLRDKLASPGLEQLRQRVSVSYHIRPLDADETHAYINHRLRRAAQGPPLEFDAEVTALVHARSRGVPRIINVICDAALVFGYAEERRIVDRTLLIEVLRELEATRVLPAAGAEAPAPALAPAPPAAASEAPPARPEETGPAAAALAETRAAAERALAEARQRTDWLARREEQLADRERQLNEQRRILAEEYRLLRGRAELAAARPAQAAAAAPPRARGGAPRARASAVAASPRTAPAGRARESVWARLKRLLFGTPQPAVWGRS